MQTRTCLDYRHVLFRIPHRALQLNLPFRCNYSIFIPIRCASPRALPNTPMSDAMQVPLPWVAFDIRCKLFNSIQLNRWLLLQVGDPRSPPTRCVWETARDVPVQTLPISDLLRNYIRPQHRLLELIPLLDLDTQ